MLRARAGRRRLGRWPNGQLSRAATPRVTGRDAVPPMEASRIAPPPAQKPPLLEFIGWVTIILGFFQMVIGLMTLIFRGDVLDNVDAYSSGEVTAIAVGAIIIGGIYVLVGRGFLSLNPVALVIGVIFGSLGVIGDLVLMFNNDGNHFSIFISLLINLIVLIAASSGFSARRRVA